MIKKTFLTIIIACLVFTTGCDNTAKLDNKSTKKPALNIENSSWLRDKLPEKTLAYMRIPTLWNMFFEGNADSLYPALSHPNNQVEVEKLQQALVDTYVTKIPDVYKTHFKLLVKNIKTPLEVAITNAVDGSMVPNLFVGTTLRNFSHADLQVLIDSLVVESDNLVRIIKPLSDDGKVSLMAQMIPIHINYDLNTGKLAILGGPSASRKAIDELLSQTQAHASLSKIFEFENSVDQSGKNQQIWINTKALYQQNQAMIPPPQKAMMEQMGLSDIEFVWMGTAQHSGKGQFILHVQMPDKGFRQFLPKVNEDFDIQTAGKPDFAFVISLPTPEQISQAFEFAKSLNPDLEEMDEEIQTWIAKTNEYLGIELSDLLNAYGQQLYIVKDDSGLWYAQKIKDVQLSKKLIATLTKKFDGTTQSKTLSGVLIDESIWSFSEAFKELVDLDENDNKLDEIIYGKLKTYAVEENGYYVFASVPQVLADRSNSKNKQSLKSFLQDDLQLNWNQAFLAWATESEYVSRDAYHKYLEIITLFANIAQTDVDLFNFPTAQDLNLPEKGRIGVAINSSDNYLSLNFSYEHSILESFSGSSGMFVVAMTGIMAAYAIPAYRDYTFRSKIMEQVLRVSPIKIAVAEQLMLTQMYPTEEFIAAEFGDNSEFKYNQENGSITILLNEIDMQDKYINLIPIIQEDDSIYWHCEGNVSEAQLPPNCF